MLTNEVAIASAKIIFPPKCQSYDLFMYQPSAKQKTEMTNQTAKLFSPNLKISVSKKFERNISTAIKAGAKYDASFFVALIIFL